MSDSIESVQLAPNGVVTDIYPANENEAGKIDLIHDKDRGKISCYARDNHTIITQGPFKLKQGGSLNIFQVHSSYTKLTKKMMN